jgi:hypothetical protein
MSFQAPQHLVDEIKRGRCIAFVGAGFSAPVTPSWADLLKELAGRVPDGALVQQVATARTATDYEMLGQLIKERLGDRYEPEVQDVLNRRDDVMKSPTTTSTTAAYKAGRPAVMKRRLQLLEDIPFKAILTLNVDPLLRARTARRKKVPRAELSAATRWDVLRGDLAWWERADPDGRFDIRPPVLKLHGDANGSDKHAPVVLARGDYRRLLYEDARYANFLRAVFSSHTVLFMGVSFTDAYLNELRSEILAFLQAKSNATPWYAILEDKSPEVQGYFKEHEGIEVLAYDSKARPPFSGFDRWLEAIQAQTSPRSRLKTLLAGKRIVWVDKNVRQNAPGIVELLDAGAELEVLNSAADLGPRHASVDLVLTCFGYRRGGAAAFDVMARVNEWPERPPAMVFASGHNAEENRAAFLRRGGWEYASGWQELFRLIEKLFGRRG